MTSRHAQPKEAPITQAYAYGNAFGNPGPGGIGVVVRTPTTRVTRCAGYHLTTKDRMAIIAAKIALKQSPPDQPVKLHTNSRRVFDALQSGAIYRWREDNWKARVGRKPIKDNDLWRQLLEIYEQREVELVLLPSLSDITEQVECEKLASKAMNNLVKLTDPLYRRSRIQTQHRTKTFRRRGQQPGQRMVVGSLQKAIA